MYANNFDQPLSPMSDSEDWIKFIDPEAQLEKQSQCVQGQDQWDLLNDGFSTYVSASSPQDSDPYHIDLNLVNDKLNDLSSSSSTSPIMDGAYNPEGFNMGFESNFQSMDYSTRMSSVSSADSKQNTRPKTKKAPKRRAPRKKLTETQKAAHNVIEKKYRININTKIENLQRLIPSITTDEAGFKTASASSSNTGERSKKLNKSLILDKAIEYIDFLQRNQMKIVLENAELKAQLNNQGFV